MRRLKEATNRGFNSISNAIRQQPNYNTEVSDEYLEALRKKIDSQKPVNFALTPISESGW
jgi:hypothetical protein